ncbi:tripartite tricarboxylate transporter substrate-binding protein [Rhodovarius lipocyclicus]|uniref:tripartite tricarboxylate transporter substrate-binding protein n=1 Tax=Rhodovarius lipocyclicus TaxID=268410 RepID=UPI00135777E0|nr:tripartite tricarboxylate transporter substrate-binding protein [Rhodovarius lipocyclicus]
MLTRRLLLAAPALIPAAGRAQGPSPFRRPIRIVVSSAAGASLDTLARVLAPAVSARIGQPVVVENQGGANGLIATQQVARAEPDGTTLLVTGDAIVLAEIATPQPGLTFKEAFAPVVQAVKAAQILVTHPGTPFRDVQGYVAAVKAQPGRLNVGIPALGGIAQVVHELLASRVGGLPVEYLSYRGGDRPADRPRLRHHRPAARPVRRPRRRLHRGLRAGGARPGQHRAAELTAMRRGGMTAHAASRHQRLTEGALSAHHPPQRREDA